MNEQIEDMERVLNKEGAARLLKDKLYEDASEPERALLDEFLEFLPPDASARVVVLIGSAVIRAFRAGAQHEKTQRLHNLAKGKK